MENYEAIAYVLYSTYTGHKLFFNTSHIMWWIFIPLGNRILIIKSMTKAAQKNIS